MKRLQIIFNFNQKILPIIVCLLYMLTTTALASIDLVYDSHGTKSNGMGGTYTGIDDYSEAIFYNWAMPTQKRTIEWKMEQSTKLETDYLNFSINSPLKINNIRLGLLYSAVPNITQTTLNDRGQPIETGNNFNQSMVTLFSSYALDNPWLNIGLRHTFYYEKIYNARGSINQLDLALYKALTFKTLSINLGSSINNILKSKTQWSTGYQDKNQRLYNVNLSGIFFNKKLILTYAQSYSINKNYHSQRLGANYYIIGNPISNPYQSIYLGRNNDIITAGTSLNIDGWLLDYTWSYFSPFTNISKTMPINEHRLSIGKSFKKFESPKKEDDLALAASESLFKQTKKLNVVDTSIIANAEFKFSKNSNETDFFISHLDTDLEHQFNGKYVNTDVNYKITLPVLWIIKDPNSNELTMITIEKTDSNKLHMSGYLPKTSTLFINDDFISPKDTDASFYHKLILDPSKPFRLEIDILDKKKSKN
jgi:hypothetical protein